MEVFAGGDYECHSVHQTRKITQITGFAPKSSILEDAAARKEINACRAPPKNIPTSLRKDFVSGRRNAAACLNEVCQLQRWSCNFIENTPSKQFDAYGRAVFAIAAVVNGYEYPQGEAKTKKASKVIAASNALIEILMVNDDEMSVRRSYHCDNFGRAVSAQPSHASSRAHPNEVNYEPLPTPVVSAKMNFLPAPQSYSEANAFKKLHIAPRTFDSVGMVAEKKLKELFATFPNIASSCLHAPVAMFVVKKTSKPGEVVAVGSGDWCYLGNEKQTVGNILFDCHAETIGRRAFRRYLIQQIKLWYKGDDISKEQCILEKHPDSEKFCVKHTVMIHLYLSKQPKGLARLHGDYRPSQYGVNLVALQNGGSTEQRLSSKNPYSALPTGPMACMSGSDKIMKWNVCGIQGSILSNFLTPVYLSSITLGCDTKESNQCDPLCIAVNQRVDMGITGDLPDMFVVHSIPKIGCYVKSMAQPNTTKTKQYLSANWTVGDACLEIINAHTGVVDAVSPVEGPFSRLSKAAFYHSCIKLSAYTDCKFQDANYLSAKNSSPGYKKTKEVLISHLKSKGFGHWVERAKEVNIFKPF